MAPSHRRDLHQHTHTHTHTHTRARGQRQSTILVLSALSSYTKAKGTTSRLLECCSEVLKPQSTRYLDMVHAIEEDHLDVARAAMLDPTAPSTLAPGEREHLLAQCDAAIRAKCAKLRTFMSAAEIIDEISPRSRDVIMGMGERLSALLCSYILRSQVWYGVG